MRLSSILPLALGALLAFAPACQDDGNTIGTSIVQDDVVITVDSAFTLSGRTVAHPNIQSRTINQLLGRIDASQFGAISSDFVTQFMPASRLDTSAVNLSDLDSLMLVMSVEKGNFVGDSIMPMGLEVYPLVGELPNPIYSDFNPEGYYSPTPLASVVYNLSATSNDTVYDYDYRQIRVKMPIELGRKLFAEYKANPSTFDSPEKFAKFFPGVYIKNSYGSGRISTISSTLMSLYYHKTLYNTLTERDTTIRYVGNYFAVTPEIITNNNISLAISPAMKQRVAEGQNIIMAPTGYDVSLTFPAKEIIARLKAADNKLNVINSLTFSLPGETIENEDGIDPPSMVVLLLASKANEFFADNDLPDNITEFYASWNSVTNSYSFGDMSKYLLYLLEKDEITEEDYTFVVTPATGIYETDEYYGTTTLTALNPYVGNPAMVRVFPENAKIKFTFTSQSTAK